MNIKQLKTKYKQLEKDLQNPKLLNSPKKIQQITTDYKQIGEILEKQKRLKKIEQEIKELQNAEDDELKQMAGEEIKKLEPLEPGMNDFFERK